MNDFRATAARGMGILGLIILQSCGGYHSSSGSTLAAISITVSPTAITLGQSTTLTWTATAGTSCTASGAWSGSQATSGTMSETPTTTGTETFTLSCSGSIYSSNSASATLTVNGTAYSLTNLVANVVDGTATVDAKLANPWGVSMAASPEPSWVANHDSNTSTLYDGNGKRQPPPPGTPLIVNLLAGTNGAFSPTGIVANPGTSGFNVTSGATTGSSAFIFSGEGGMIAGWSPAVSLLNAVNVFTAADHAVYKGLAIAANNGALFLYATDFHNNKVDVFDTTFAKQATSGTAFTFADPAIPAGFAPFGIQAVPGSGVAGATQIYVTYAQQVAPANLVNATGAGLGYVDVYDTNGKLIKQLIATGALNAPWGLALAPADFGSFSKALLVGNAGDGKINAYDPAAGSLIGTLSNAGNTPLSSAGLLGLAFGNDANNQPHNTLFFAAGGANGIYGRIDPSATPPALNAAPVVTLAVPAGTLSGTVALSATAVDPVSIAKIDFKANGTIIGTAMTSPFAIQWASSGVANGQVSLTATATDADGSVGTSSAVTSTVSN
jgi:uncharacterized protein (TIGR03118 family)